MGGGFIEDEEGNESDDPLADEPWSFNAFDEDIDDLSDFQFAIRTVPSSEIICAPVRQEAKVIDRYLVGEILGEGSYGKVKEGLDIHTLNRCAIKIMKKRKLRRIPHGEDNVKREIWMLKRTSHKNIIRLFDVIKNNEREKIYMVMDYCVCAMHAMLKNAPGNVFPEWQAHSYFCQLIDGLEYLHGVGIIHKDIKPSNLLISTSDVVKISDFGVAEQLDPFAADDSCVTSQGSPAFQPPEVANGVDVFSGYKLDVWATGVTLFNILTGKYPFEGDNIYKLFNIIGQCQLLIPPEIDGHLKILIAGLLEKDFNTRFSVHDIRNQVWFKCKCYPIGKKIPFPALESRSDATIDNVNFMTTVRSLEWFNNDKFVHVANDKRVGGEDHSNGDHEQTFLDDNYFSLVRESTSSENDVFSPKEDGGKKKAVKTRKFTPSSCKPM